MGCCQLELVHERRDWEQRLWLRFFWMMARAVANVGDSRAYLIESGEGVGIEGRWDCAGDKGSLLRSGACGSRGHR